MTFIYSDKFINYLIACYVSADSNITIKGTKENLKNLKLLKEMHSDILSDYQIKCIDRGIALLEDEIKNNKPIFQKSIFSIFRKIFLYFS